MLIFNLGKSFWGSDVNDCNQNDLGTVKYRKNNLAFMILIKSKINLFSI